MTKKIPSHEEVDGWDLETALSYGRTGLVEHADDKQELINRRNVLITSHHSNLSPVLREVVMLSLAAEDLETVREVVGWLEEMGDPAMGYYVYKSLVEKKEYEKEAEEFLHASAKAGFFPAQRILGDRLASSFGPLSFFILPFIRLRHSWRVYHAARANPKDLRLK